ncbi:MAG: nucleotide exchange factor GrpE [Candidatus Moranbacteria bacterium]|nr:nucleotide exchange factor GrpE [Candidatus Moranbacteria bacterium]
MPKHKETTEKPNFQFELSAKVVVVGPDGKVLILTRSKHETSAQGKRDLPGGSVDSGETVEEAVRREIMEKAGLSVTGIAPLPVYRHTKTGDCELQRVRFIAFSDSSDVTLDPMEHSAYEWLTPDEAIAKLSDKGFEADKRESVMRAKEYMELQDSLGGWKRCLADFDNYKKRQEASQKEMGQYLVERLLNDLVPVLDNFHAAASHVPEESKDNPWVVGIGYIEKQLEDTLAQHGVRVIEVKEGDAFDPSRHEALSDSSTEAEEGEEKKGHVIAKVLQNGYTIGDKVVRAAKVSVR